MNKIFIGKIVKRAPKLIFVHPRIRKNKMFVHKPVLLNECIEGLSIKASGVYVDCTLGGAGHSIEIYKRLSNEGCLIGLDQDKDALLAAKSKMTEFDGKARFLAIHTNFRQILEVLEAHKIEKVDGFLMDLGVSSHQLDEADRGFSYKKDAPLDMRMDQSGKLLAYEVVNTYSENALKCLIREYGEEKWAARIASFIVSKREEAPIRTTTELVEIIKAAIPSAARREGPHPAKRTFQSIRIEVNNELGVLESALVDILEVLAPGGRLAVITFHSLEDRIVKNAFTSKTIGCTCSKEMPVCICKHIGLYRNVTKKPIVPYNVEILENPRARSAKLRIIERI